MSSRLTAGAACRLLRSTTTSVLRHRFSTTTTTITNPLPKSHPFLPFSQPYKNSTSSIRFFSTRPTRSIRTARPDIGAKARQLQSRRLWAYAITFSCVAGFIVIVLNQFQDQLVFYLTPTDALAKYELDPSKSKFRLGGLVLEGSVMQVQSSPEIEFVVTDLQTDILVKYEGSLPDLFREGHSVVVEGFIKPFDEEMKKNYEVNSAKEDNNSNATSRSAMVSEKARIGDCYFRATDVLAKHDEKYMPQEVAAKIEENKKMLASQQKEKEMEVVVKDGEVGSNGGSGTGVGVAASATA